jgi:hypothetical protein
VSGIGGFASPASENAYAGPGGGLRLPAGYSLGTDPDLLALLREDGSPVAHFSARGALPEEIVRAAWEDRRGRR